jgi:hypothetical protein
MSGLVRAMPTVSEKKEFLEKDFFNSLCYLFESAVVWHASKNRPGPEHTFGMYTNFVESRALYEFFFSKGNGRDNARARHFCTTWRETGTPLYLKYMKDGTPAQKRVFHLVYNRSSAANAGGPGHDHPDHLKHQVLNFAKDLKAVTERFAARISIPDFRTLVDKALADSLDGAQNKANECGIPMPL